MGTTVASLQFDPKGASLNIALAMYISSTTALRDRLLSIPLGSVPRGIGAGRLETP